MSDLNNFCLQGRLGRDPQVTTPGAKTKVYVNLAVESMSGKTIWVTVAAWEKTGEFISKHFRKGDTIILDGHFGSYKPKDSAYEKLELIADHVHFPGSKKEDAKEENDESYEFTEVGDLPF